VDTQSYTEVKDLQRLLKSNLFDPGPIDGSYGTWTQKAELLYKQSKSKDKVTDILESPLRSKVIQTAISLIGKNTIQKQNKSSSSTGGFFISYCADLSLEENSNPYPCSGLSSDLLRNPTWTQTLLGKSPKAADVFGIYFASQKKIGQLGFIVEWMPFGKFCLTVENNQYLDQVMLRRRNKSDIYAIQDWISLVSVDSTSIN